MAEKKGVILGIYVRFQGVDFLSMMLLVEIQIGTTDLE